MSRNVSSEELVRYVAGECTPPERQRIERRLEEDSELRRACDGLRRLWKLAGRSVEGASARSGEGGRQENGSPTPAVDLEEEWGLLSERLDGEVTSSFSVRSPAGQKTGCAPPPGPSGRRAPVASRQPRSRARLWGGVAALLVVVAGALAYFYGELATAPGPADRQMHSVSTRNGEQRRLRLPDGTIAHLNASSSLHYPKDFERGASRMVALDGEGYFEVVRDTARPFLVKARGGQVRVLGTEFGVSAYPESEVVEVVVAEGRVAFGAVPEDAQEGGGLPDAGPEETHAAPEEPLEAVAVLSSADYARLLQRRQKDGRGALAVDVRRGLDVSYALAWTRGQLVFDDVPISEATRQMERWYDVKIRLEDRAALSDQRLRTRLQDMPLGEALDMISRVTGVAHRFEAADRIVLHAPPEN